MNLNAHVMQSNFLVPGPRRAPLLSTEIPATLYARPLESFWSQFLAASQRASAASSHTSCTLSILTLPCALTAAAILSTVAKEASSST